MSLLRKMRRLVRGSASRRRGRLRRSREVKKPRRRFSYRRTLARQVVARYVGCWAVLLGGLVIVGLIERAELPPATLAIYLCCGLYLRRYIAPRSIMLSVESAQKIAEAKRAMLLLWPISTARFLHHLLYAPAS
jgi:hypothetical protein